MRYDSRDRVTGLCRLAGLSRAARREGTDRALTRRRVRESARTRMRRAACGSLAGDEGERRASAISLEVLHGRSRPALCHARGIVLDRCREEHSHVSRAGARRCQASTSRECSLQGSAPLSRPQGGAGRTPSAGSRSHASPRDARWPRQLANVRGDRGRVHRWFAVAFDEKKPATTLGQQRRPDQGSETPVEVRAHEEQPTPPASRSCRAATSAPLHVHEFLAEKIVRPDRRSCRRSGRARRVDQLVGSARDSRA